MSNNEKIEEFSIREIPEEMAQIRFNSIIGAFFGLLKSENKAQDADQ